MRVYARSDKHPVKMVLLENVTKYLTSREANDVREALLALT